MTPLRLLGALIALTASGCRSPAPAPARQPPVLAHPAGAPARPAPARPLVVPHASGPLQLNGELDEADWRRCGRSGPFVDPATGQEAHPYSEARFLWDERQLYLALYAADEDIRTADRPDAGGEPSDVFTVRFAPAGPAGEVFELVLGPGGSVAGTRARRDGTRVPWASGARLGVDLDGTINDPSDYDEEWVVEAAIPLASLGVQPRAGATLRLSIERCDTPKTGERRCGAFGRGAGGAATRALVLAEQ
jgi:hypothetical protein